MAPCRGVLPRSSGRRQVWRQDRLRYHNIQQLIILTCTSFGVQYSLSSFWPLWYHRCPWFSTETVVPSHQEVLSDPWMVSSRQKRHTSGSCVCHICSDYCINKVYLTCGTGTRTIFWCKQSWIRYHWMITISCNHSVVLYRDYFWNQVASEMDPVLSQHWRDRHMTDVFLTQLTWGFLSISVGRVPWSPVISLLCVSNDNRDRSTKPVPSPGPRPYETRSHMYTGPLVITNTPSLLSESTVRLNVLDRVTVFDTSVASTLSPLASPLDTTFLPCT